MITSESNIAEIGCISLLWVVDEPDSNENTTYAQLFLWLHHFTAYSFSYYFSQKHYLSLCHVSSDECTPQLPIFVSLWHSPCLIYSNLSSMLTADFLCFIVFNLVRVKISIPSFFILCTQNFNWLFPTVCPAFLISLNRHLFPHNLFMRFITFAGRTAFFVVDLFINRILIKSGYFSELLSFYIRE